MDIYSIRSGTSDSTRDSVRNVFTACLAEFVGTFMFMFFGFAATQISNIAWGASSGLAALMYASLAFGVSLAVNIWLFYRVSGGLFNPVVSLALSVIGAISFLRAFLVIIFQFVAGIAAAGVVSALFPGPLLASTRLGGGTSISQGLFIEMFLTSLLVLAYIMLSVLKHRATFLAPLGIGLAMFICGLAGVYFTGASLNPARSLGPDTIIRSFPGYHWIYWVGPGLGALLAVGFYLLLRALGFETCNPEQDDDGLRIPRDDRSV